MKRRYLLQCLICQTSYQEQAMIQLTFEMPESAFSVLHQAPKEFAQEMRVAAAVKW